MSVDCQAIHGAVVLAEQQLAGRGRRGRQWLSPFGANLMLSIGWQFDNGISVLDGLSLAVGVVVVQVLSDLGVEGVGLKWPNDIFFQGKKLGGVLIELTGDIQGRCAVVLGIGLNVNMSNFCDVDNIDQPWTDLARVLTENGGGGCNVLSGLKRGLLASKIVNAMFELLDTYEEKSFASYIKRWNELNVFLNKNVILTTPSSCVYGRFEGVSSGGSLILRVNGELKQFSGGEISLRGLG